MPNGEKTKNLNPVHCKVKEIKNRPTSFTFAICTLQKRLKFITFAQLR